MADNKALHRAAKAQQDEFYTQMFDIENELRNYREHFEGKKILCNCDDPYESNFFKYFAIRFNAYRLAKLTATCYAGSPIAHRQLSLFEEEKETQARTPYCAEITEFKDYNEDTAEDLQDIRYILEHNVGGGVRKLQGNGDFRSPECIKFLEDSDIVVTNPPFSLLREFIALLIQYDKKFIIVGNVNAITYKEVFPLFMQNRMWLGHNNNGSMSFRVPDSYEPRETRYWEEEGPDGKIQKWRSLGNICWFTNLDHGWRHRDMILSRSYERNPELYPHYDNYDAIEVSKTSDIPADYFGVMGVPITFMDKYNPDQFEIIGCTESEGKGFSNGLWKASSKVAQPLINGKRIYKRIFIRRKRTQGDS